jgi:uncharacterized damage-inducible protein DinB
MSQVTRRILARMKKGTSATSLLLSLAENNAWSNLRLYRVCAKLTATEFAARGVSFFPSLPATLNHILIVDWYYIDALENAGRGRACFEKEIPFADFAPLENAQRESDARLLAYVKSLDDSMLDREVKMQRRDHVQVDQIGATLMHLFTHQIHHRGQVHAMLAGTPQKPPQLDEFFMRDDLRLRQAEMRDLGFDPH